MNEGLVDLSLFDASPTNDHRFDIPEIPPFQRSREERSWSPTGHGAPHQHEQTGTFQTMKPLPPLPRRICVGFGPDPRRVGGSSRCILSRMRRSRSDNLTERPIYQRNRLHQRRNVHPIPQLTLSEPPQQWDQGRAASPMVWMPDEQMWLVVDEDGFATYQTDVYESIIYSAPPAYDEPSSARSEPSHRERNSESSPIRNQFLTLMQRRESADEMSPLFQEAIHGVDWREYSEPYQNEPPSFRVERDWRSIMLSALGLLRSGKIWVDQFTGQNLHHECTGFDFLNPQSHRDPSRSIYAASQYHAISQAGWHKLIRREPTSSFRQLTTVQIASGIKTERMETRMPRNPDLLDSVRLFTYMSALGTSHGVGSVPHLYRWPPPPPFNPNSRR
ncbi:hypothetical protein MMC30_001312 [Trapelia coarctata]|nr:hypothetical protein [Trapelia coarctata]